MKCEPEVHCVVLHVPYSSWASTAVVGHRTRPFGVEQAFYSESKGAKQGPVAVVRIRASASEAEEMLSETVGSNPIGPAYFVIISNLYS